MNKVRLYWIIQLGGWATFVILQLLIYQFLAEYELTTGRAIILIMEGFFFFILTHLFRNWLIKSGWLALEFRRLIPRSLLGVLVIAFVIYFARVLVSIPVGEFNVSVAFSLLNFLGLSSIYALIAFVWTMAYLIYHYFERYNLTLQRQAAMHEIELNNLKSQLNPHFIFNSLNSIRALVDEDPRKSKHAITQLSMILRNTLVAEQKSLTKFDEELRTVRNYLGLESIRYEERLKIDLDIDPRSSEFQVPPLMLQTLVENGIKHGISQLKEGGLIRIRTFVKNELLHVEIRNSGHYRKLNGSSKKRKVGLGLINTQKRLDLIYGGQATFRIDNDSENTVLTELIIPKNTDNYESNNS